VQVPDRCQHPIEEGRSWPGKTSNDSGHQGARPVYRLAFRRSLAFLTNGGNKSYTKADFWGVLAAGRP
jgi:hypothetical protein